MLDSVSIDILVVISMLIPLLGYTFCDGAALVMACSKEWSSLNFECFLTTNLLIQSLCLGGFVTNYRVYWLFSDIDVYGCLVFVLGCIPNLVRWLCLAFF